MADWLEPRLERLEYLLLIEIGKLLTEALQVAEGVFVNEAHQAEQLQQRVLQWRRREQQLVFAGQRQLERVGDDVRRLVDVAQAVRFVNDHQIPWLRMDICRLALGELVGADNDLRSLEWAELAPA